MGQVKILIADDHEVVRRGLRELLETRPNWKVCGEATDGHDAISKARLMKPDVIVLDITMPKMNGLEATRQIIKAVPRTEVLVLTMHESGSIVRDILSAGARGYVLKSDAGRELIMAIDSLIEHKPYFTSKVSVSVLTGYLASSQNESHDHLSPREREILQLVAEGNENKEIANIVGISIKTVEAHRTNLMRKLNVHSASEIVRYAIRNNIIAP